MFYLDIPTVETNALLLEMARIMESQNRCALPILKDEISQRMQI